MNILLLTPAKYGYGNQTDDTFWSYMTYAANVTLMYRHGLQEQRIELLDIHLEPMETQTIKLEDGTKEAYECFGLTVRDDKAFDLDDIVSCFVFTRETNVDTVAVRHHARNMLYKASHMRDVYHRVIHSIECSGDKVKGNVTELSYGFLTYRTYEGDKMSDADIKAMLTKWLSNGNNVDTI